MEDLNERLDVIAQILWRSFFLGTFLLLFWAGMYLFASGPIYNQCTMFGLTAHECSLVHYGGMGLFKFLLLTMFLIPFISVRLVLHKRRKK